MAKYIKVDDLMAGAGDYLAGVAFVKMGRGSGKTQLAMIEMLNHLTKTAPAEDVVPVVRCKVCTKREQDDMFYRCVPCGYKCNDGEWFCPAGVRRNGDES